MSRPFTEQLKEGQAVAGVTATPAGATLNNTSLYTSAINMSLMRRARAFFLTNTLTSSASLNLSLQASATQSGVYTDITCTTTAVIITAMTTDNAFNAIEISADNMPNGKPWLRANATETASQNAVVAILLVADCASQSPGNHNDTVTWTNNVVGSNQAA